MNMGECPQNQSRYWFCLDLFWMEEKWHYIKVLIILLKEIIRSGWWLEYSFFIIKYIHHKLFEVLT